MQTRAELYKLNRVSPLQGALARLAFAAESIQFERKFSDDDKHIVLLATEWDGVAQARNEAERLTRLKSDEQRHDVDAALIAAVNAVNHTRCWDVKTGRLRIPVHQWLNILEAVEWYRASPHAAKAIGSEEFLRKQADYGK